MTKKIIAFVLALISVLAFAACGKSPTDEPHIVPIPPEEAKFVDNGWRNAYAEYLSSNMSMETHVLFYAKGQGKYALFDINQDKVPELFIIDTSGKTMIHSYDPDTNSISGPAIADGGTDVLYFKLEGLKFGHDGNFTSQFDSTFSYFKATDIEGWDFVNTVFAYKNETDCIFTTYDEEKMCEMGTEYALSVENITVTPEQYNALVEEYSYSEGEYRTVSQNDIYPLTEEGIQDGLR